MFPLSDRCAELRDEVVNKKYYSNFYGAQRNVYNRIGNFLAMKEGLSNTEIVAAGIVRTLNSFTPVILPGEIIAGFNFGEGKLHEYYYPADDQDAKNAMRDNGISEEDIALYFELQKNPPENPNNQQTVELTDAEIQMEKEWTNIGRCIDSNHTVLGYEQVLKKGFSGLLNDVIAAEQKNGPKPMYSAIKVDGTPLYKLAREGKTVERTARGIRIESISARWIEEDEYEIDVSCSKGTYIRTLIYDIGEKLSCGATMTALRRTKSGVFTIARAKTLGEIEKEAELLPVDFMFSEYDAVTIDENGEKKCRNGAVVPFDGEKGKTYRVYSKKGEFLMLAVGAEKGNLITIKSFFEV